MNFSLGPSNSLSASRLRPHLERGKASRSSGHSAEPVQLMKVLDIEAPTNILALAAEVIFRV
jgi:hypothetical protein